MGRLFQVFIPGELPGRNESEWAARLHHMAGAGMKRKHTNRVAAVCRQGCDCAWVPMDRFVLHVEFRMKSRRKDPDNILGGLKYLLDGLVTAGVVRGDRWANVLGIYPTWTVDKERPGVKVIIEGD